MIPVSSRASTIEYAIRDVVVPATKLEAEGHEIIKLNIGDPIAYPGLPTPQHMVEAYREGLASGNNGYSPSYGLPKLRSAIAADETRKGWNCNVDDVYVCHGVTEALQIIFAATLDRQCPILPRRDHGWVIHRQLRLQPLLLLPWLFLLPSPWRRNRLGADGSRALA